MARPIHPRTVALCAALLLGTVVLSTRSLTVHDSLQLGGRSTPTLAGRGSANDFWPPNTLLLESRRGKVRLLLIRENWGRIPWRASDDLHAAWPVNSPESHDAWEQFIQPNMTTSRSAFGFELFGGRTSGFYYYPIRGITIPSPAFALIALAPLLLALRYHLRRRGRLVRGECLDCGYDLRGSPAVCPECGTRA